jgi:SNF2 family DNA or RNA helicase
MPHDLKKDLFVYQVEDSNRILNSPETLGNTNFLNFSEMGTGKTPIALNVVEAGNFKMPLVICPNSLRLEWARQIEDWIGPNLAAVCKIDSYQKLDPLFHMTEKGQKYFILNYESLRKDLILEVLQYFPFDIIIFDECHYLRNPKTKAVMGKQKKDPVFGFYLDGKEGGVWKFLDQHPKSYILPLSGSPLMNLPTDIYVPLSLVKPERFKRETRAYTGFTYEHGLWASGAYGNYMYGSRNMTKLKEETAPFTIRRTKKEVLPFLPDKYYRRTELVMKDDQRALYNRMETELKILLDSGEPLWSTSVLATLTRLRQINLDPKIVGVTCSSAKTDYIVETVESTGEKIVIFSCFEKYIELLSLIFAETPFVKITGTVPVNERQESVKKFQEDPSIKLCLCTIQTGGEGITLTAASNVILSDRWWNNPRNNQAVDRLHRIGQLSGVQVIIPVVEDSVDQTLDEILNRKDQLTNEYLGESAVTSGILSGIKYR